MSRYRQTTKKEAFDAVAFTKALLGTNSEKEEDGKESKEVSR